MLRLVVLRLLLFIVLLQSLDGCKLELGIEFERLLTNEGANVTLKGQRIEIVVDLRQYVAGLVHVTLKLGELDDVVRLRASLLLGVVNEHRVGLIPTLAQVSLRVARGHVGVAPDALQSLVALDPIVVIFGAQAEGVAAPYGSETLAVGIRHDLGHHPANVLGLGRRPDGHDERLQAVLQERSREGPLNKRRALPGIRSVEQRAVEVHDDEDAARHIELRRGTSGLRNVSRARVGHTAGLRAGHHICSLLLLDHDLGLLVLLLLGGRLFQNRNCSHLCLAGG